jgi:hypothetical protein
MPYAPFYELFPDVAPNETRSIHVLDPRGELPLGEYGFLELFCNEEGCDCRRAFINVMHTSGRKVTQVAAISYGWEDASFYRKWASFPLSKEDLHELKGPALLRLQPQSEYAPILLEHFEMMLRDQAYAKRIERHYEMYRRAIDEQAAPVPTIVRSSPKVGRNEPCPCGSGKKFKRCCAELSAI